MQLFKIPIIPARDSLGGTTFLLNCLQGGTIIYANTKGEVEDLCKIMLDSGVLQTGWDLEWPVNFRRGEKAGRVALMQICYQDPIKETYKCLLFHIKYTSITASLHAYLTNPVYQPFLPLACAYVTILPSSEFILLQMLIGWMRCGILTVPTCRVFLLLASLT